MAIIVNITIKISLDDFYEKKNLNKPYRDIS